MGLDISVYAKIEKVDCSDKYFDCGHLHYWAYEGFEDRLDGLPEGHYVGERQRAHDTPSFSYSGYGAWRNTLAWFACGMSMDDLAKSPKLYENKPFFRLIWFADNEGCIGPQSSKVLADDFKQHRTEIAGWLETELPKLWDTLRKSDRDVVRVEDVAWFLAQYDLFTKAFEIAAGGCVEFH